jgi:predicted amidohydrolase YtcJ
VHADLVFAGGLAFVQGRAQRADVAVRGDRILAVGASLRELIGPATRVVPVDGLLIPGIQDAHAHPVWGGLESLRCNLSHLSGAAAYRERIAAYARENPHRAWITGGGWSMSAFPSGTPHRRDLDDIVPDRPALLHNGDHHGAWVNGRALEVAGIDRHTPDPPDGRIERDCDGIPGGMLHEGAVNLVARHMPVADAAERELALRKAQAHLHGLGITGWQDAILGDYGGYADPSPVYRALASSGELTARVCGALWWDRPQGTEQIPSLIERRAENQVGRFRAPMVKMMLDGICENFTAAMTSPYLGGHGSGLSFVDFGSLKGHVHALAEAGFGVHFHAIGDAAARAALDAVTGLPPGRHQIAHLQVVHPDDVPRFGRLHVIANLQPLWACHEPQLDELAIPFLGPQRSAWLYPFGDLLRGGAPLAAGSDWPVTSADPWQGMHVAVHRCLDGAVLLPGQRLSLSDSLLAYTRGSAYANGCDEAGVIAPGRLADLVLLSLNPFDGDILGTRVLRTYVGGELVHDAG